ncbi:OmpA family protein [Clostridium sp. KNHs214]|uniref:OmpA family protein n=1 Tax=Clostridium sp. KNHs214 TaxID=1540257 RepID=UPI000555CA3F|nr:OmpA family protein [Clostridium sp. KNHs214]
MSRKKKNGGSGLTGEEWLTTYSDTITLLLTFFVLLYSMSTVNTNKFKQIASSLQSVLSGQGSNSILDFGNGQGEVPIVGETAKSSGKSGTVAKKSMYEEVARYVKENKMKDKIEVLKEPKGVVLRLKESVLFDIGKGEVKENSADVLNMISNILQKFPESHVIVEGHTDNVPISTYKYPSNWELSTARAVNVLKYFVETNKMNPDRFTAAGYGEQKPIVPNDNDGNRAKNRRVNIIIEDTTIDSEKGETK